MPRRYVMAISCICHYRPAHKLVTAHLECRTPPLVCLSVSSFFPPPAPASPSLPLVHLGPSSPRLTVSLIYLSHFPSFTIPSRSLSFFFVFCAKRLPPSRLHSGGEASIVIVPHQRRSAINLSPCRAESERSSPRADHTRNTGRAINLCPLAIV